MNAKEIMNLYNRHERMHIDIPGWVTHSESTLVKLVSPDLDGSFISYFKFNFHQANQIIDEQISFFSQFRKSFEWKVYDTDKPNNISQLLLNSGFYEGDEESFMVLDLSQFSSLPNQQTQCVEVANAKGIRDAILVKEAQLGEDCEGYYRHLMNLKQTCPDAIRIYVVYESGEPVSSAWITFNSPLSPFAGIWGGSTVQGYRGRGYYQALLRQRIRDALLAGKRYLIIDASEMSRPIVEKYGFKVVTKTTPYMFNYSYFN